MEEAFESVLAKKGKTATRGQRLCCPKKNRRNQRTEEHRESKVSQESGRVLQEC